MYHIVFTPANISETFCTIGYPPPPPYITNYTGMSTDIDSRYGETDYAYVT